MREGRVDLTEFSGTLDRAEQDRRIGFAGFQSLFGNGQGRLSVSVPTKGLASLDIKFSAGGSHQRGPVIFETACNLPQLQPHPSPCHQSGLVIGVLREMRIEDLQSLFESPEAGKRTAHEGSGGLLTRREFFDLRDLVEAGLPFPVLDMGLGELQTQ